MLLQLGGRVGSDFLRYATLPLLGGAVGSGCTDTGTGEGHGLREGEGQFTYRAHRKASF